MAKPQIKKVKKDSKGVTYYFSDDDGIMCVDIDIEPGVKSVVFQEGRSFSKYRGYYSMFLLRDVKKQFPDVERLIISGERIYTIGISNMMFPNVKEVIVKDNDSYEPGPYLMTVKYTNDGRKFCLLNAFCSDAGSVIDLKDVTEISSYAFEGCMAGKIINCKDVSTIDDSSFCGYPASMCENNYKDGALVFENMLVDIDAGAEHVTTPEEVTISTSKWFNLGNVKELVFQKMSTIPLVNGTNFNGTVTINDDSFMPVQRDIDKTIRNISCSAFKITESNKQICAVDGVIYSKDKKILIAYPRHKQGDFVIPDGTEIIYDKAFSSSDITSVKIPDSVYRIKSGAFSHCKKLKRIGFNKTITDYSKYEDDNIFYGCQSLEPFTIPSHIETLGQSMFSRCEAVEIKLQEGIRRLDADSILLGSRDSLDDELIIPSTLQVIESRIIRQGQHKIRVRSRTPTGLVNAVTNTSSYTNNDGVSGPFVITLTIEEDGKEYVFYIPRFLSLETSKNLDNFFNMYSPSAMCEEYMDSLYEDTPCLYVKQDTALELYHLTGKQFYKDFLKKSKNSIIKRYFDRGQEKEIIDFLQFGFFASSSLDKFRKIADEREMSVLSAYILEEQKKKAPKTTTKFTI